MLKIMFTQESSKPNCLTIKGLHDLINRENKELVSLRSVRYHLNKTGFKLVHVTSRQSDRVSIDINKVCENYSYMKEKYSKKVPSCLFFNCDECGCNGTEKHSNKFVIVPKTFKEKKMIVSDGNTKSSTSTILACISLDGKRGPTALVINKFLIFMNSLKYFNDVKLYFSSSGFITSKIFYLWFKYQFIRHVEICRIMNDLPKDETAVLLMDNATSHNYKDIEELAIENHIEIHYIESHTSHVCQPLDLNIFGVLKQTIPQLIKAYKQSTPMKELAQLPINYNDESQLDAIILGDKLITLFNDVKQSYSYIKIPIDIVNDFEKCQYLILSKESIEKLISNFEEWLNTIDPTLDSLFFEFIDNLTKLPDDQSLTDTDELSELKPQQVALLSYNFNRKMSEIKAHLEMYKDEIESLETFEERIFQKLIDNDTNFNYNELKVITKRREHYEQISQKMLDLLTCYEKSTISVNIVKSFELAGIMSEYYDEMYRVVIDIKKAANLLKEYPNIKENQSFESLSDYVPPQKIYHQVIIDDNDIRDKHEAYERKKLTSVKR